MVEPKGAKNTQRADLDVGALSATYSAALKRYFLRQSVSAEDADDLVQEVFVRLVRMDNQDEIENSQAFLFRIAANLLKDKRRRHVVRQGDRHDAFEDDMPATEVFSPERVLIGKQELAGIKDAIIALPPKTREAFILHRFEGLTYREISEALGISVSSVEKHMMSAIASLAKRGRK